MDLTSIVLTSLAVVAAPRVATADDTPTIVHQRTLGDITGSYQLQLAMDSAGPVLFKDTPDKMLEKTTVFEYGGRLAFLLGNERLDVHRFGVGVGYDLVARSDTRKLALITPQLVYETGHPIILQVALGAALGNGTSGFASNYGGFYSAATVRYSFLDKSRPSPVSVSFGLTGRVVVSTKEVQYSSAFIGGQLELVFHLGDQGDKK